ncbi:hypothetical protein EUZ95_05295 [Enterococcus durans]|uniref:hypothetical protein n=1 Tax=Enterococcus durans TaxID=53345 RepID=UPI00103B4903|nr:hypothetical protein [Enterococcus durans]TBX33225.1 hypothetical protein EUZ95_05295 [Enterococcus durans]
MKKADAKSIISIFVGVFLLMGVIEFIFKRNHSFILSNHYFEFLLGFIVMKAFPIGRGWAKVRYFTLVFLSFYLPIKIGDLLSVEGLNITLGTYLIVLGIFLLIVGPFFYRRIAHRAK